MAMQTIAAIDYMSALKVCAIIGLIQGIIAGVLILIGGSAIALSGIPVAAVAGAGLGAVGFIMAIIGGLIGGAITGIVGAAIYNIIIVKLVGGLKIDLQ